VPFAINETAAVNRGDGTAENEVSMNLGEHFRVAPGSKVKLRDIDPGFHGKHEDKQSAAAEVENHQERMQQLQRLLYADHRRSLLIVLQALDAGGKDGTVAHVFRAMNPEGIRVAQFKKPTEAELAHDFLWRVHQQAPVRGEVVIFNRSHYEDVLAVRVHGLVPKDVWSRRYDRINEFEANLVESGTAILKFYLHISEDEQLARFEQRLTDPMRRWKISESDYTERALWPAYVEAFEDVFHKTSTKQAPWYVIPANHKWFRDLAISSIVADAMNGLGLELPAPTVDIDEIRRKYHAAVKGEPKLARSLSGGHHGKGA
jgi:PPK2 family polyphosphate:nucleotide phosphotransferase